MDIKQNLKNFGLEDEEINLYLAGLKLGESPLALLAKEAGIKRGSAYLIAKNLESKGLMGSFKLAKGLRFVASSPNALAEQAKRRFTEINDIMPGLKALETGSQSKPTITVYEGEEGYFTVLNDSLKSGEMIRAVGSVKKLYEIIGKGYDDKHYIPARIKNKIKYRGLHYRSEVVNIFTAERNARELREIKYLPETYNHPTFSLIYQHCLAIFTSKKELVAVKIKSEEIAESEKNKFDLLWQIL